VAAVREVSYLCRVFYYAPDAHFTVGQQMELDRVVVRATSWQERVVREAEWAPNPQDTDAGFSAVTCIQRPPPSSPSGAKPKVNATLEQLRETASKILGTERAH